MAEVAVFYRWRLADIEEMDWSDLLSFHASIRRMTRQSGPGSA